MALGLCGGGYGRVCEGGGVYQKSLDFCAVGPADLLSETLKRDGYEILN